MEKTFQKIETYTTLVLVFLFPVFTLPISPNVTTPAKLVLLAVGLSFLLIIKAIRAMVEGKLILKTGTFDFAVILILLAHILSAYFRTSNKMEAILLPGTATAIVAGGLLYLFINQMKDKGKLVEYTLFASAILFSFLMIVPATGILTGLTGNFAYLGAKTFTPTGGYLPAAIFLITIIPIALGTILTQEKIMNKVLLILGGVVVIFGLGLSIYNISPGQPMSPKLPSYNTSWNVAIDALKESPLLGVGAGNYLTAFNRYRPTSYNNTELWAAKFSTANSYYMTMVTETGIIGLVGLLLAAYILFKLVRTNIAKKNLDKTSAMNMLSLLLLVLMLVAFPATVSLTVLLFVLMALNSHTKATSLNLTAKSSDEGVGSRWPAVLFSIPVMVIAGFFLYRTTTIIAAEYTFRKAVESVVKNEAIGAYDTMQKAIERNPYVDRYHVSYAQINLALANAIASQANEKGELTDEQRQQITSLIQQAIREGRAAVALNPYRSGNWVALGRIYQSIIPLAKGADVYAAQSYAQAVALDPMNPNTRIALGGLYYGAGNYETAVRIFELAATAKRDHANARYNLAYALKNLGKTEQAVQEMTVVLGLLKPGDTDYDLAAKALEEFQNALASEPKSGDELTAPEDQEQVLEEPVELTDEDEPPADVVSPTPIPVEGDNVNLTITPEPTQIP